MSVTMNEHHHRQAVDEGADLEVDAVDLEPGRSRSTTGLVGVSSSARLASARAASAALGLWTARLAGRASATVAAATRLVAGRRAAVLRRLGHALGGRVARRRVVDPLDPLDADAARPARSRCRRRRCRCPR